MVQMRIHEEILYREALALGLDKDDTVIRRRMVQKMEFLSEDLANAREPTIDELRAWFQQNSQRFTVLPRASFRHLYFSPDIRGRNVREDAARALAKPPKNRRICRSRRRWRIASCFRTTMATAHPNN